MVKMRNKSNRPRLLPNIVRNPSNFEDRDRNKLVAACEDHVG